MADPRFFSNAGPLRLTEIAKIAGAELIREGAQGAERLIRDVAPLDRATQNDVSFLDNIKYIETFAASRAGACFIRSKYTERAPSGMALFVSEEPYRCFALIAQRFYPTYHASKQVSAQAMVSPTAKIGKDCTIEAGVIIGEHVEIGARCHISPGAVLYSGVTVGEDTHIGSNSTLSHCIIGKHVIIHRGVHIGQDGFGFALGREGHIKVPQLGRVVIEDNVEIGSGTCVDRGTGPDTFIGEGTKIDNLVQIGHNVHIGRQSIIVAQAGISGSSRLGDGVTLAGQVGIAGHLKIGHGARIAGQSGVMHDIPAGASFGGTPAVAIKDWHRQTIALARMARQKGAEDE